MQTTYNIWSFYSAETINQAIENFEEIANIKYNPEKQEIIISWEQEDREEVFNELMNYAIYLEC